MSIEGLDYILQKREVVPTVSANDLLERAEQVDTDYKRHVRTYVPLSRAGEGKEGQLTVEKFVKNAIRKVKNAQLPRGYITAEYGYGKTSTALYLWSRAGEENLVVVLPFQMLELQDLITATHGWVSYRLKGVRPDLVLKAENIYQQKTVRSIEQAIQDSGAKEKVIRQWVKDGRFTLSLQTAEYIKYFEEITAVVQEAGFEGLILLPDELQQYIDPKLSSGAGDPISPFFNLIQAFATREGRLNFGFIIAIPLPHLGVIREAKGRGDLIERLLDLNLDLTAIYDQDFAKRLWDKLALEFKYTDIAYDIVFRETLDALGEIASRNDLSNGPRTVINIFRRMVERYLGSGHANSQPYSPLDLVDDLLKGAIPFSGNNEIQNVTRRALQSAIVRSNPEYEDAIKMAAAFPTDGVPRLIQKRYKVKSSLEELMRVALGELVMAVGPLELGGITLVGLDRVQLKREWLPQTIRDFNRSYKETLNDTRDRAIEVFAFLIKDRVFRNWRVDQEWPSTYTANHSIIFEGDFQSFTTRFPKRRVHARIFWEDEEHKDELIQGDLAIDFKLSIHSEQEERQIFAESLELFPDEYIAKVPINLMYIRPEGVAQQIQDQLQKVWSPYDLTPLVLMNVYEMLNEKRAAGIMPKHEDQFIQPLFQPDLLDEIVRDLFNPIVGETVNAAGERIIEAVVETLLDARYGKVYKTLKAVSNWRNSLQKYTNALQLLENIYQRRGEIEFEGTKDQIAKLFLLAHTGLDSFMRNFDSLLEQTRDWPSKKQAQEGEKGAVKFSLHPQERLILEWIKSSSNIESLEFGGKHYEVHTLTTNEVYDRSEQLGYHADEVEQLIDLLTQRDYIDIYQKRIIRELPSESPDAEGLNLRSTNLQAEITTLLLGFPDNKLLIRHQSDIDKWQSAIQNELQSGSPDPEFVFKISKAVQNKQIQLREFVLEKQKEIKSRIDSLLNSIRPINQQYIDSLEKPIEGEVIYVDQVAVLRTALLRYGSDLKGSNSRLRSNLEFSQKNLGKKDLAYEDLIEEERNINKYSASLDNISDQLMQFETCYQHLSGWRRLVTDGSRLFADLQEMEGTVQVQYDQLDQLGREIRAEINSQANKLSILAKYAIYENQLSDIITQIHKIRTTVQSDFTNRQNRYRNALTTSNFYRREQLDRPFEFNFSNPGESNRLLDEAIQRKILELIEQLEIVAIRYNQVVLGIINTRFLKDLPSDQQDNISNQGDALINNLGQLIDKIDKLHKQAADISLIRDFPVAGEGQFIVLIDSLSEVRDNLKDIGLQIQKLGGWLAGFELTPQEEEMLGSLKPCDIDELEDLVIWKNSTNINEEDFWRNLRNLFEKRRIRITIGRVRM